MLSIKEGRIGLDRLPPNETPYTLYALSENSKKDTNPKEFDTE
jgi:hypothetical protein